MSQYKNIPQPQDQRNVSQGNILENYQYLCTALGGAPAGVANGILPVDHQASGDNVANPKDGFHNQVSFVNQTTPASLVNAVNGQTSNGIEYVRLDGNSNGQIRFLNNLIDQPVTFIKAAVQFDGTTLAITGNAFNVSSITRVSGQPVGVYNVNFTVNMPSTNYLVFVGAGGVDLFRYVNYGLKFNGRVHVLTGTTSPNPVDCPDVSVMVIGFF